MHDVSDSPPAPPPPRRPNGNRVPLAKRQVVAAMLDAGETHTTIRAATGLCRDTIRAVAAQEIRNPEQVERIKKGLRAKAVLLADSLANAIIPEKIKKAGLGETMKSWAMAMDRAGIGPVSHQEIYINRLNKYKVVEPTGGPKKSA
jgi:hypothetical protein